MFNPFRGKPTQKRTHHDELQPDAQEASVLKDAAPSADRRFLGVLTAQHITEKANAASERGWYAFHVAPGATKHAVRRAVEGRYGVHVIRIRMIRGRERRVRLGRVVGRTMTPKKAMVKLRSGETISIT